MKKEKLAKIDIPAHIFSAMEKLGEAGFEATVVGGCVRDLLMGAEPKDWDVATSARPEEILRIFPDAKYENAFGTVTVPEKYLISLPIISENIKIEAKDKKKLISIANGYLEKIKSDAHRIGHSERVVENALIIAREYGRIAPDVIEIAGYFHDTGRSKYADVRHVEESINIFRKEAEKYLDKKTIQIIAEIIEHRGDIDPVSLEQRIIKEADIIDGINVERYIIAKKIKLTELLEWVKNKFNNEGVYLNIITQKGRELLHEKIKEFNGAELGIQIPENIFSKNSNIEITTYRIESKYSDKRHPDVVRFAKTLKEDLSRRDFTINALAIKVEIASKKNPPHPDPLLIKERELNDGRKFEL